MEHIQLVISKECPEEYIEIIKDYWKYEVTPFDFINKPKRIREKYTIPQQDLNKIIKPYSKLTFYFHCTSCNSYEFQEVRSQSACVQKLREIKPSKFEEFKCEHCENQMKIEKLKQKEEDRKKMIARLEKAVDEQRWEELKDFEYKLLDHCVSKDLTELKQFYGTKLGKDQIKRLLEFSRKQAVTIGEKLKIKERTVDNYLAKLEQAGYLLKPKAGYYKKKNKEFVRFAVFANFARFNWSNSQKDFYF